MKEFPYVEGCNEDTSCDGCLHLNEETLDCKLEKTNNEDGKKK